MITIYHNPACSKSREALQLLEESGQPFQIRLYLEQPLSVEELTTLQNKLHIPAISMVRVKEPLYKTLCTDHQPDEKELLTIISRHPALMERAIVEKGDQAVIARPPDNIYSIL